MICQHSYLKSFLQSILYAGVILSYFTYSYITDNYGRKFSFVISNITFIIGIIILSIGGSIVVTTIGVLLFALGMAQVQSIGFMIYN